MQILTYILTVSTIIASHGSVLHTLWDKSPSTNRTTALTFSPKDDVIAIAAKDGSIRTCDTRTAAAQIAFTNSAVALNIAFASDDLLEVWTSNYFLQEIQLSSATELSSHKLASLAQTSFSLNGLIFAGVSAPLSASQRLALCATHPFETRRDEPASLFSEVCLTSDGNLLAISEGKFEAPYSVDIVSSLTGDLLHHFDPLAGSHPKFSPPGNLLGGLDRLGFSVYDLRTRIVMDHWIDNYVYFIDTPLGQNYRVELSFALSFEFSLLEDVVIFLQENETSGQRSLQFWVPYLGPWLSNGFRLISWSPPEGRRLERFTLSHDGRLIAAATEDGHIYMLEYPFSDLQLAVATPAYSYKDTLTLFFVGGNGPFQLQQKASLSDSWQNVGNPTLEREGRITPIHAGSQFFRVTALTP
jgi:WD40 repeat protein